MHIGPKMVLRFVWCGGVEGVRDRREFTGKIESEVFPPNMWANSHYRETSPRRAIAAGRFGQVTTSTLPPPLPIRKTVDRQ